MTSLVAKRQMKTKTKKISLNNILLNHLRNFIPNKVIKFVILPLNVDGKIIFKFKKKAKLFNSYFA